MDCYFCHLAVLSFLIRNSNSIDVSSDTSYKNCLTWRDDRDWLHLMCRVANFVLPVTFYHNASNTEVKCRILKDERGCIPKERNFTIDESTQTVTLVLYENKTERHLEGRWYCKQGESTQITDVSFLNGITHDSVIYLRGTVGNESKNLYIECSSCRKPKGPYIEIIIDGKTEASFRQTDKECWYKDILCSDSNICKCTETQNAFSLRLNLPNISISTNISCYMQFVDTLRGITYSVTATHEFTGKDFSKTGNETTVIHTIPVQTSNGFLTHGTTRVQTATEEPIPTTSTSKTMTNGTSSLEKRELLFAIAGSIIIAIVLVCFCGLAWCIVQKRKSTYYAIRDKSKRLVDDKDCEYRYCHLCKSLSTLTSADLFCFDCNGTFCSECVSKLHDLHITVPITNFPHAFDPVSFFKCHGSNCYQYYNEFDKALRCNECKNNEQVKEISNVSAESIRAYYNQYMLKLMTCQQELDSYQEWLQKGKEEFSKQKVHFLLINDVELIKRQREYYNNAEYYKSEVSKIKHKTDTQEEMLELLNTQAEKCHLFIALHKLNTELVLIERKINIFKTSFYKLEISDDIIRKKYMHANDENNIAINVTEQQCAKITDKQTNNEDMTNVELVFDEIQTYDEIADTTDVSVKNAENFEYLDIETPTTGMDYAANKDAQTYSEISEHTKTVECQPLLDEPDNIKLVKTHDGSEAQAAIKI